MDCGSCRWWVKAYHDGECRRYPARVGTPANFWCGEYVEREVKVVVEEVVVAKRGRPRKM